MDYGKITWYNFRSIETSIFLSLNGSIGRCLVEFGRLFVWICLEPRTFFIIRNIYYTYRSYYRRQRWVFMSGWNIKNSKMIIIAFTNELECVQSELFIYFVQRFVCNLCIGIQWFLLLILQYFYKNIARSYKWLISWPRRIFNYPCPITFNLFVVCCYLLLFDFYKIQQSGIAGIYIWNIFINHHD